MIFKKFMVFLLVLTISVLLIGCGDDDDNTQQYYINFTIDGQVYNFTKGYSGVNNSITMNGLPSAEEILSPGATPFQFYAFKQLVPTDDLSKLASGKIVIQIGNNFTNEGTYSNFSAALYLEGISGNYLAKSTALRTLTVDKCEGLGGIVSGTFSCTISNKTTLDEKVIQDGKFRLIHTMTNSAVGLH